MIYFTEKVTEVLAGEQNKRLCNPDSFRGKILFCVALGLVFYPIGWNLAMSSCKSSKSFTKKASVELT